jgi:fimbrial isopeptide formation D2 family protein/LPXTG-motif cell wall-anchored protein
MILSLASVVFADEPVLGTITINGVSDSTTYSIYRILLLESYNKESGAYSYLVDPQWTAFMATDEAKAYIAVNADGYVSWIAGEDDATVAAFAKLALAYAKEHDIDPDKTSKNDGDMELTGTTGVFSNLELGWYLVDSTAGALCGLTTTDPDASINAKNQIPTIDKQVQEDLTGMYGDSNSADIGQIVEFMTIIHAAAGAENYVMHDTMSEGLTFVHDTDEGRGVHKVTLTGNNGVPVTLVEGEHYIIKTGEDDCEECSFEVLFKKEFVATLNPNDRLIIYYNAMLNRHAAISGNNTNESWLEYGEEKYTTHDQTITYTYSIDIIKTDSSNQLIDGAKFRIYDAETGGNEIKVVPLMEADNETPVLDANDNPMYRRARADEEGVDILVTDGKVTIIGFDNGTYYLEEVAAPAGYNKLTSRTKFIISDGNLDSVFNNGIYSTGSGVHVVNKTGTMLPETGGLGTLIFTILGGTTALGTGVVLVTKKRMSNIDED